MKKIFAVLAMATFSFTANAHGPTPQKVEKTITIKAEPSKVWNIVKDFGGIHKWHPAVKSTKLSKKGKAVYRELTLQDGGIINEKLRTADDKRMRLKYEIVDGVAPVADYYSKMTVKAGKNDGESTLTWMGRFYRTYKLNPPIPEGQDDETAYKFVSDVYDAGLAGIKELAESSK